MQKTRMCTTCGKMFKNSSSLASHKHRYHPYSKETKIRMEKNMSLEPDKNTDSSKSSSILSHPTSMDKVIVNAIDDINDNLHVFSGKLQHISKRLDELESKMEKGSELPNSSKMRFLSWDVETLKHQYDLNNKNLASLTKKIQKVVNVIENLEKYHLEDRMVSLVEVKDMFLDSNYETLNDNIMKLKKAVTLVFELDIGGDALTYEDDDLLQSLKDVSDDRAKWVLRDNFYKLLGVFKKIAPEVDRVYHEYYENDSEEDSDVTLEDDTESLDFIKEGRDDSHGEMEYASFEETDDETDGASDKTTNKNTYDELDANSNKETIDHTDSDTDSERLRETDSEDSAEDIQNSAQFNETVDHRNVDTDSDTNFQYI